MAKSKGIKKGAHGTPQQANSLRKVPKALQPYLKNYALELSPALKSATDEFLRNPPDINNYEDFVKFFTGVAKCVLRAEVDEQFPFNTKTATTLAYVGTIISLGLDRAAKESGMLAGMQDRFDRLSNGPVKLTLKQCADILKLENRNTALLLIEKYQEDNKKADSVSVEITEVEPLIDITRKQSLKEQPVYDESDYAF
jgi:hypothetical protein